MAVIDTYPTDWAIARRAPEPDYDPAPVVPVRRKMRLGTPTRRPEKEFSPEEYILIRAAWGKYTVNTIAAMLDCATSAVNRGAKHLRLGQTLSYGTLLQPTRKAWVDAATLEAHSAGVEPDLVMAKLNRSDVVTARWRAWARLRDDNPRYSVAGIARASSFDHSTILRAFKELERRGHA